MKVIVIGGTGLLGLAGVKELIKNKHQVKSISLEDSANTLTLPKEAEFIFADYELMSDEEIREHFQGHDSLVFASGVDERSEYKGDLPLNEYLKTKNITPMVRLIKIAKELKFKSAIILGSYFTYLDRLWENLYLYETHPYIKNRLDQSNEAFSFSDRDFAVSVLEISYVFGTQPGRKPVWTFLVEQIERMKLFTFYPKGGTAMITVNQVGQAISKSVETAKGAKTIPLGYYNLTWKKMLKIIHKAMGYKNRKVISLPKFVYKLVMLRYHRKYLKLNIQSGLNLKALPEIMTRKAYIDNHYLKNTLKVKEDDLEKAIKDSIILSLEFVNEYGNIYEMK
jgi:nucleoside-diphosphate-sugar epimerase